MKKMNKKLHAWATENNCHVWELTHKKQIKQWFNHNNEAYVLTNSEGCKLINSYNTIIVINKGEIEIFDGAFDYPILISRNGIVIKEKRG